MASRSIRCPASSLMMHKPLGVTCSHKETGPLVYRLLPDRWRLRDPALSTVGRLDKETSGLLLLTDDGALLHKIISPRRQIAKALSRDARPAVAGRRGRNFRRRRADAGGRGQAAAAGPARESLARPRRCSPSSRAAIIRFGACSPPSAIMSSALHRASVGGLTLPDDLAPGEFMALHAAGIAAIFADA